MKSLAIFEGFNMRILFVCLGNICRSPLAEGIFREKVRKKKLDILTDSAGTGSWHAGEHPDPRAIVTAKKFGVDISDLIARQFTAKDFDTFDKIYVMDGSNYSDVIALAARKEQKEKVDFFLNVTQPGKNSDVPDPWYGGPEGFVHVFKLLEEACDKLILELEKSHE
jgi:protein-tyrosine phosphatase